MSPSAESGKIDAYIAAAAPIARPHLTEIRRVALAAVPGARETISYKMPALWNGRVFFYFAAFKDHIGVYPPVEADAKLKAELAPYANAKGNLRFPFTEPVPYPLIGRVAAALARQYAK